MDNLIVMLLAATSLLIAESLILAAVFLRLAKSKRQGEQLQSQTQPQPQDTATTAEPDDWPDTR